MSKSVSVLILGSFQLSERKTTNAIEFEIAVLQS
jgi:hypothetical protein